MSVWFLRFTREMSLPTYFLIFKGYQGMLKEFGDSFEYLMYVSIDGVTRGYRQQADDARFSKNCQEALKEKGLAENVLDHIEKRVRDLENKQKKALARPSAQNVGDTFEAYESLWKLYIIPLYWASALEGKPESPLLRRIQHVRELTGGTAHTKGAEGLMEELVREVAKTLAEKTDLPSTLFHFATPDEILACLEGKTPPRLVLEQRKRAWVLIQKKGLFRLMAGGEAEKVAKKEVGEEAPATKGPLKGAVAFGAGSIEGIARVVFKVSKSAELQEGEILVTPMTSPEIVPAMKRAAAIITDEGGMACHAAILARELGIPCLVGTKDATRVFKSGDRVRINFETAIVENISGKAS